MSVSGQGLVRGFFQILRLRFDDECGILVGRLILEGDEMMKRPILSFVSLLLVAVLLSACSTPVVKTEHILYDGQIETDTGVYMNTIARTITFGENSRISYSEGFFDVSGKTFDFSEFRQGQKLYFHPRSQSISSVAAHENIYLGKIAEPYFHCQFNMDRERFFVDELNVAMTETLSDKKVVCLGDSMTAGVATKKTYAQWFDDLCEFSQVETYGEGGSSISPKVDEIPTWDNVKSFCERYSQMEGGADVVIVFGGVNDWIRGRELGHPGDKGSNTFCGAVDVLCNVLKTRYPDAEIFFFSSPQNNYVDRPATDLIGTQWENNVEGFNRKGYKLTDYAAAMGEVCQSNDVHFYSLTEALPWGVEELGDKNDVRGTYGTDGLHPNADGHALIAREMVRFMAKTIYEAQ